MFDFAVLMSVYKSDDPVFFRAALESITTKQTVKPKQVVLVKDGYVNEEIDLIVDSIKKQNPLVDFVVVSNDTNRGLAYSLNKGSHFVKTDWIARMDSDDISVDNRFEMQMSFLKEHPDVVLLGGLSEEFNDHPGDLERTRKVPLNDSQIKKMLKSRNPFNHPTVVFRKDVFDAVGGYSVDFGKMEDYKLWIDLSLCGCFFANLDNVLVNMRVGNGFLGRRSGSEEIENWKKIQKYLFDKKVISRLKKRKNILIFSLFVKSPLWLKKIAYKKLLRTKNEKSL